MSSTVKVVTTSKRRELKSRGSIFSLICKEFMQTAPCRRRDGKGGQRGSCHRMGAAGFLLLWAIVHSLSHGIWTFWGVPSHLRCAGRSGPITPCPLSKIKVGGCWKVTIIRRASWKRKYPRKDKNTPFSSLGDEELHTPDDLQTPYDPTDSPAKERPVGGAEEKPQDKSQEQQAWNQERGNCFLPTGSWTSQAMSSVCANVWGQKRLTHG